MMEKIELDGTTKYFKTTKTDIVNRMTKSRIMSEPSRRKIIRSWLSERECAEYWDTTKDDGFWTKLKAKVANLFGKTMPQYKLRSVLWSPFRGDKLYPFFDDSGDMVAFSREYKKKDLDDHELTCFMTVTKEQVYQWELDKGWELVSAFKHGFRKIPVILEIE